MSLRDSMKKLSSGKKKNYKVLKLKNGDQVNVKFLPYISKEGEPLDFESVWYHYNVNNSKSYLCSGKFNGCPICESGLKPSPRNYSNVQIIKSNNVDIKEGEIYIFYTPWSLKEKIEAWEIDTNNTVFFIFDSPEVALISEINEKGYESLDNSYITDSMNSMIEDIEDYSDEELIEMLKFRTKNLKDLISTTLLPTSEFPNLNLKEKMKDSEEVKDESNDVKVKSTEEINEIVENTEIEEAFPTSSDNLDLKNSEDEDEKVENDENDTLSYINNYLESID